MSFSPKKIKADNKMPDIQPGEKFYENNNIQLWLGDARRLDFITDRSVQLIVTSPPYNVNMQYDNWNDMISVDEYLHFTVLWLKECYRVLCKGGRLVVNVPSALTQSTGSKIAFIAMDLWNIAVKEVGFLPRDWIIWKKPHNLQNVTSWGSWCSPSSPFCRDICEFIIVFSKEQYKLESENKKTDLTRDEFMILSRNIWTMRPENRKLHPAPFPLELPLRVIRFYSFINDTVLDPFVGSGTTALASKLLNRKCIGVDINKSFLEIAKERIAQQLLFNDSTILTKRMYKLDVEDDNNIEFKQLELTEEKENK